MGPNLKILNTIRVSALVVPLVMTSGCMVTDMADDTHDMRQNTSKMGQTTENMAKTTEGMAKTTSDMAQTTQEMAQTTTKLAETTESMKKETIEKLANTLEGISNTYKDLRQVEALKARHDTLLDEMQKADVLEAKIVAAGKFCMAFEFQLWKNNLSDTTEYRDQLYRDAMEEFFLSITRYLPDLNKTPDPTSKNDRMLNFLAIAATIDRVNPNAQVLAGQMKQDQVSILTLIHDGLRKSAQVESGDIRVQDLKPYEEQVLIYRREAIALLQTRANILPMILMSRISDIQSRSLPVQAWMAYVGTKAKFDNAAAMKQGLQYIGYANDEILFLKEIGVPLQVNGTLKSLFNHLSYRDAPKSQSAQRAAGDKPNARVALENALVTEIDKFKGHINSAN